jgi:hypothetical protein
MLIHGKSGLLHTNLRAIHNLKKFSALSYFKFTHAVHKDRWLNILPALAEYRMQVGVIFSRKSLKKSAPKPFGAQLIETTYMLTTSPNARPYSFLPFSLLLSFDLSSTGCAWGTGLTAGVIRWPIGFARIWTLLGGLPLVEPPRGVIPPEGGLFGGIPFNWDLCGICVTGC